MGYFPHLEGSSTQGSGGENSRGNIPTFLRILNESFREAAQEVDLLIWNIALKMCGVLQVGRRGHCWRTRERKTRKTEGNRKSFPSLGPFLVSWVSPTTRRMGSFIWESWDKARHWPQRGSLGPALRNQWLLVGQRTGRWHLGPEAAVPRGPGFSGILQPLECWGRAANTNLHRQRAQTLEQIPMAGGESPSLEVQNPHGCGTLGRAGVLPKVGLNLGGFFPL